MSFLTPLTPTHSSSQLTSVGGDLLRLHAEFLEQQERIYAGFRNSSVDSLGMVESFVVKRPQSGYCVVLRHPPEIARQIESVSRHIGSLFPSLIYDLNSIHTTLAYHAVPNGSLIERRSSLKELTLSVREALKETADTPLIELQEWLVNRDTVILAGYPTSSFVELQRRILHALQGRLEIRLSWGAHTSVSRPLEAILPSELEPFFQYIRSLPSLGVSRPRQIDVGAFECDGNGIEFNVAETFELN